MWAADPIPLYELNYICTIGFLLPHLNWNSTKKTSTKKISINLLNTAQTLITLSKWQILKPFGVQHWIIVEITISLPCRKQLLTSWAKGKWNFWWHYHSKRLLWGKQICSLWVYKLWTENENKNIISLATLLSPWCHTNQLSLVIICRRLQLTRWDLWDSALHMT